MRAVFGIILVNEDKFLRFRNSDFGLYCVRASLSLRFFAPLLACFSTRLITPSAPGSCPLCPANARLIIRLRSVFVGSLPTPFPLPRPPAPARFRPPLFDRNSGPLTPVRLRSVNPAVETNRPPAVLSARKSHDAPGRAAPKSKSMPSGKTACFWVVPALIPRALRTPFRRCPGPRPAGARRGSPCSWCAAGTAPAASPGAAQD